MEKDKFGASVRENGKIELGTAHADRGRGRADRIGRLRTRAADEPECSAQRAYDEAAHRPSIPHDGTVNEQGRSRPYDEARGIDEMDLRLAAGARLNTIAHVDRLLNC
nr:hypothetical protein [Microvirga puerhi]